MPVYKEYIRSSSQERFGVMARDESSSQDDFSFFSCLSRCVFKIKKFHWATIFMGRWAWLKVIKMEFGQLFLVNLNVAM